MAAEGKGRELVHELIKAIEEDRELRYMLLGALGFNELLERFARLEERQQRLEERFAELEERFARLEERQQRLEERFAGLEERVARLEERFAELEKRFLELGERQQRLEERFAKLEERFARLEEEFLELRRGQQRLEERYQELAERIAKLEERFAKLEERVLRVEEEIRETRRVVVVIAHRFGVLSEESFRSAMKYVVEDVFGVASVGKWVHRDQEGFVYGYPAVVEVDILVRDGEHILLEVKSRVSKADVAELYRIGVLYEKVEGKKPRLAMLGGLVDEDARRLAERLGVDIVPIASS